VRKEGYRHFHGQGDPRAASAVLAQTISGRIADSGRDVVLDGVGLTGDQVRELEHVQIVACGTSWHADSSPLPHRGTGGHPRPRGLRIGIPRRAALLPKRSLSSPSRSRERPRHAHQALRGIRGQGSEDA